MTPSGRSWEAVRQWMRLHQSFVISTLVVMLAMLILAVALYQVEKARLIQQARTQLQAEAENKVMQLERWLHERKHDAQSFSGDAAFVNYVAQIQKKAFDDETVTGEVLSHLLAASSLDTYQSAILLTPEGYLLHSAGAVSQVTESSRQALQQAAYSGQLTFTPVIYQQSQRYLDMVVPLIQTYADRQQMVAAVILRIDPYAGIFSRLTGCDGEQSACYQVHLVRPDENRVQFLTAPERNSRASRQYSLSMDKKKYAAVQLINTGQPGLISALNVAGQQVLAAYQPVSGQDWYLVVQQPLSDITAPVMKHIVWQLFTLLLLSMVILGLLWRNRGQQRWLQWQSEQLTQLQSAQLLQNFFYLPLTGMAVLDANFKIQHCNRVLATLLGQALPDDLQGRSWGELMISSDALFVSKQWQRMQSGLLDKLTLEVRLKHLDASIVHAELTLHALRYDSGKLQYVLALVNDINERINFEAELRAGTEKYHKLAETLPVPLMLFNAQHEVVYLNQAFKQELGYDEYQISSMEDCWQTLCPDLLYRQNKKKQWETLLGDVTPEQNSLELELHCRDGRQRVFLAKLSTMEHLDQQYEVVSLVDITQHQQLEDSLRQLSLAVEQSPSSIVITDIDARIEYVNEGFVKHSGYTQEEAKGRNPRMLRSGKNPAQTYQEMWGTLTRGEPWRGELINRRKNGEEYTESVIISPLRQPDGSITHYVAVKDDITERKKAEQQLRDKLDELKRWYDASMGREMRIIELKNEVNELLEAQGQAPRYFDSDWVAQWDESLDDLQQDRHE